MPSPAPATAPPAFFGWRVTAAAFVAQLVANAAGLASAGVFVTTLEREFETTTAVISAGPTLCILLMALVSPFLGRWLDAGPQKLIMMGGVALLGAGLWIASHATTLPALALGICLFAALGIAAFGPMPSIALVSRWFVRRRGLAVGVAVAGATLASAVGPPLAALAIDALGWRTALRAMALAALALALPAFALLVVKSPEEVGQHADGDAHAPPEADVPAEGSVAGHVLRRLDFYLIALGLGLVFASPLVSTMHLPPFAEKELGIASTELGGVFAAFAAGSLVGKLAFGALASAVAPRVALWANAALLAAGWALLATRPSLEVLVAAGALFGLGIGAAAPLQAVLIGACFGRRAFAEVMGLAGLVALPIIAPATWLAGVLRDAAGSYSPVFAAELAALAVAALMFAFLRVPQGAAKGAGALADAPTAPVGPREA
ncbi:MAG: MFS transporter [Myxococcota bacterium]